MTGQEEEALQGRASGAGKGRAAGLHRRNAACSVMSLRAFRRARVRKLLNFNADNACYLIQEIGDQLKLHVW